MVGKIAIYECTDTVYLRQIRIGIQKYLYGNCEEWSETKSNENTSDQSGSTYSSTRQLNTK